MFKTTIVTLSAFLLLVACSNGFSDVSDVDNVVSTNLGDRLLSDFYVPPGYLKTVGSLLRTETLTEAQSLMSAGDNIRLLYTSTDGISNNRVTAVSGALYLPEGEPPEGGWPLLIWSHGTVGVGDVCAPSFSGRSERDRTYLNPWLERGFAIAASDYQGLGTPGTHPYMDARTMAYNNLDLIRSLLDSEFPLSSNVIVSGQSQGATAALATSAYSKTYASDIKLSGVIATGIPFFSNRILLSLSRDADPDAVGPILALTLYFMTLADQLDPDFSLEEVISDEARPTVSEIGNMCVFDFIDATTEANLSPRKTFTADLRQAQLAAFERSRYPEPDTDVPIFAGIGTKDQITPLPMQMSFVSAACKTGASIDVNIYDGANHNQGLLQSTESAMAFADRVLEGGKADNDCEDY